MTSPEHENPRDLTEAALPPDEIPQYPPTDLPDVNRLGETTDATDSDRQHTTPGNESPGFPVS